LKAISALLLGTAAVLTIGLAAPLSAQMQPDNSNDKTKVYAYQKRAPASEPAAVATPPRRQVPTPSYASDEIPYGSQHWWRENERLSAGAGGSE
jgi:hypothetical protein